VDWVALSFVQQPQDIEEIHDIIDSKVADGEFKPSIMAKIEKPSCFEGDNLERIVQLCDGIMVARGDVSFWFTRRRFFAYFVLDPLSTHFLFISQHHTARCRMSS
jgi:hypothetical protein